MSLYSHGLGGVIRRAADHSSSPENFSPHVVLCRILEGTEQPGVLGQALVPRTTCRDVACYVSTLGEAFDSLSTTQQSQIRNRWGSHLDEILSLSRETAVELFYEALFHLGQRLEREGHVEQAGLVYGAMLSPHPDPLPQGERAIPQHITQQAQERISVLNGGGTMGQQMEHMGRGFARQALDPGLLIGATGMGLFGKGVELIGMRYLAGANFFRRSYGFARTALEFAPRATGFALEATAFPFAINGANELLGRPVSWAHMDHRIYGSWFFLGGMRMGNRLGASASRSLDVPGLQTIGSIGGVGLGLGGEVLAGFKEWHGFSNFAVETFGTWANLQVAGRFSEYVFDGQISRMQRVMDLSIESRRGFKAWVDSISEAFNNFGGPQPLAATPGVGSIPSPSRRLSVSPPQSHILHASIFDNATRITRHSVEKIQKVYEGDTRVQDVLEKSRIDDPYRLETGLRRLRHILKNTDPETSRGGYVDWITRLAFEKILETGATQQLDPLLSFLHEGGSLRDYELLLAKNFELPSLLRWTRWFPSPLGRLLPLSHKIEDLPIAAETRNFLWRYHLLEFLGKHPAPWIPTEDLVEVLKQFVHDAERAPLIERAIKFSAHSPLATLRIAQLYRLFKNADGLLDSKLQELADGDYHLRGIEDHASASSWQKLQGTQYDAYISDSEIAKLLFEIQRRVPELLDNERSKELTAIRREKLSIVVGHFADLKELTPEHIILAFRRLGDLTSRRVAKAIEDEEIDFEIHDGDAFEKRVRKLPQARTGKITQDAFYYFPGVVGKKGLMLVRKVPLHYYSHLPAQDAFFEVLANIVHEFRHHTDFNPADHHRTPPVLLKHEVRAHAKEYLWRAEHGDTGWLEEFHSDANSGFALHFRDKFEDWYKEWFK